ncbi:MAG: AsmA-like C-terminal region-containing protein [Candidatus Acidiferrales bacterium]
MSGAYAHTVEPPEPLDSAPPPRRAWTRWLKWVALFVAILWLASFGISALIRHSALQRKFTAHLEAAFGRPVEVGSYDFSFWDGPSLEANSVRVSEDARFGQEYFLYADSISVRLRWESLLRGHIELGTLSLSHPSLNLVRDSAGEWNVAEWLPRPGENASGGVPVGPSLPFSLLRFRKIEIDGGRINFKQGDEKLPFAFVDVSGDVETDSPGLWRIDLDATPWRAAVLLQQVGTIHVSGHVGGTSSRLRPAALDLSWTDASISDVLRLARGDDYGIRGTLALALNASTAQDPDGAWTLRGRAQLGGLHRWDLASRSDNPSINLIAQALWHPADSFLEFTDAAVEAPHSNVHANGRISWQTTRASAKQRTPPVEIVVTPSQIDFADLLNWLRAFHPGVADAVSAHGSFVLNGEASGWPLQIVNANGFSEGADFSGASLQVPVHLGRVQLRYNHGTISFPPATLSFAATSRPATTRSAGTTSPVSDGSFQLSLATKPARHALPTWRVVGSSRDMRDLVSAAGALGLNISRGWDLAGPVACDLLWSGTNIPWRVQPTGWIEFGSPPGADAASGAADALSGAALHAPFLNQPIDQIRARADLRPGEQHIALASARAFGAQWSGTFDRTAADPEWQFVLAADKLSAADLDRWLNPLWRESFLDRLLPFLNPSLPAVAVPENLRASGSLSLDEFTLPPLTARHLQADVKIGGRHVELANATGQLYGGALTGSLDSDLQAAPAYNANIAFTRVDLAGLTAASPDLANLFAGAATGKISFSATGATRGDLLASLACQGEADFASPEIHGIDLVASMHASALVPGTSRFSNASASFACASRAIQLRDLSITVPGPDVAGSGAIDFSRDLDLRLRFVSNVPKATAPSYRLTGSLASPKISRIQPTRRSR